MATRRTWARWLKDARGFVMREVERWGVAQEAAGAYLERLEKSDTLRASLGDGVVGEMRTMLAELALRDAMLDPVGSALRGAELLIERGTPAFARTVKDAKQVRRAAEILAAAGQGDLAEIVATRRKQMLTPVSRPGAGQPVSPRKRAAYELERVLRLDSDLPVGARRAFIASLVTEFVAPETPQRVKNAIVDAERRDRRAALRHFDSGTPVPKGAFYTGAESTLLAAGLVKPQSEVERFDAGHFSGVRAFFDFVDGVVMVRN
jgi:hypothetical protein